MRKLYWFFIFACVLLDSVTYSDAHAVLKDFLQGFLGKKNAVKEWSSFSLFEKVSLLQMKKLCNKETGLFNIYYSFYRVFLLSLMPKYMIILLGQLFHTAINGVVFAIIGIFIFLFTFAFLLVFRVPRLPHGRTKFVHYRPAWDGGRFSRPKSKKGSKDGTDGTRDDSPSRTAL